ncbi:hypothetical protein CSQ87_02710 [Bifidobacterium simiarum]|uniref:Chorismate-utilising enzyme C-terminal domain-containing protein n=2 Tax=Bifidobacterium simiarum TaxID=2045441 RepID=A0A2M9HG94_9BIFI|nr:hypothetical protein CSQ87_02710 [Bifidobacterium simiarum]
MGMRAYRVTADPPDHATAIGYLGYDDGVSRWAWFDLWLVEDHRDRTVHAVAMGRLTDADAQIKELNAAWSEALEAGAHDYDVPAEDPVGGMRNDPRESRSDPICEIEVHADQSRDGYIEAVEHMQRHMRDGDIYVANMSMRFFVRSPRSPIDVFRRLYADSPSPYAAYLDFGGNEDNGDNSGDDRGTGCLRTDRLGTAAMDSGDPETKARRVIVSSSPERFFSIWDGTVTTEPIKGTRPRGKNPAEDAALRADLHASDKERSELLMVTDLERNDMNRICEPGSVTVPEFEVIRMFPHVFHTVSVVEGRLRPSMAVSEALRLMSPGGSITGTPKRRATEIIAECERSPRGVYTGSLGYVGTDPDEWLRGGAAGQLAGDGSDDCAGHGSGRETDIRPSHTVMHSVMHPITRSDSAEARPVCDLSIIIRAAVCEPGTVKESGDFGRSGRFDYMVGAGGGVTLDSDPAAEYDEAVHKARAVLDALGAAAVADTLGTDADSTTVSGAGDQ